MVDLEPYISVGGLLIRDGLSVLLQLRDDKPDILYPGCWAIPAGRWEAGETFEAGAVRELEEETGYRMMTPRPLPVFEGVLSTGQPVTRHTFWDVYDGEQAIQVNEGQAMEFVSISELSALTLVPGNDLIIHDCVAAFEKLHRDGE